MKTRGLDTARRVGQTCVAMGALGAVFARIGQPPVIGEVVAGLMLGPSFLGRISPEVANFILPKEVAPSLGMVSQIGIVLFMFLVGLELDTSQLKERKKASLLISNFSVLVPFTLGFGLAALMFTTYSTPGVAKLPFVLFIGAAMSVTAFPVLA